MLLESSPFRMRSSQVRKKRDLRRTPGTRIDRFRQYSLVDQYKIFRYGVEAVEPPLMGLADPIAERGASAVPFLLNQLTSKSLSGCAFLYVQLVE